MMACDVETRKFCAITKLFIPIEYLDPQQMSGWEKKFGKSIKIIKNQSVVLPFIIPKLIGGPAIM